jgi:hypothetical protein
MTAPKGTAAKPTPGGLIRRKFHGALLMTEFIPLPDGGNVRGLVGEVDVLEDKEALGFSVNDRDSKWCVRVAGPTTAVTVPGCKVYLVMALPEGQGGSNTDYWRVP